MKDLVSLSSIITVQADTPLYLNCKHTWTPYQPVQNGQIRKP